MATDVSVTRRSHDASPPPAVPTPSHRYARALAIVLPIVLVLVAGTLRFHRLDEPSRIYFDETYYANDARQYVENGVENEFAVHPPVGKWLLAGGIATFGFNSFGWRFSAALAGTLTVLVVYLAGLRLFRRRGIAALAALLLTVEGLAFTMSRIAMLDVFVSLFIATGFWFLLIDRDQQWAAVDARSPAAPDSAPEDGAPVRSLPQRSHWARWLAGLAFGLALATKWSGLLAIAAAGLFVLVSELAWRRRITGRWSVRPEQIAGSVLATLVALPILVYLVSYTGWFTNFEDTRHGEERCPGGVCADLSAGDVAAVWLDEQSQILNFHRDLEAEHPYRAPATTWLLMTRPVAYYFESCDDPENPPEGGCHVTQGNVAEILGVGNPAIWWMALLAYPVLAYVAITRRHWQAAAILAFLLLQWLPWLATPRPVFLFYMTPAVPFICLALAATAGKALRVEALRWVPAAVAVLAVAAFIFMYPVYVGEEMSRQAWNLRMLMQSWI
jgi:dolichyl-phosphate-mannose-protein mannosyltransferase